MATFLLTLETPAPGSTVGSKSIEVVFTATSDSGKMYIDSSTAVVSPNGGQPYTASVKEELSDGYRFSATVPFNEGQNTVLVGVKFWSMQYIEESFTVATDTTEIAIESPAQDAHPVGKAVEVVFTATDSTSAISPGTGYVSIDSGRPISNLGRETITGGYRFTYTAELEYGEHTIVAGATNSAGKEKSATVTFENYAGPVAIIEYPTEGQVIPHGELITPVFTVTDQFVSVDPSTAYIYFSGAGRPFFIADLDVARLEEGDGYRFTLKDGVVPEEGSYTFEVSCANYKGETAIAQVAFIVNNAPVITMETPQPEQVFKSKRVEVVFYATDFVPGVDPDTAEISVNGHYPTGHPPMATEYPNGYRFSKTIDAEKGDNSITVTVQDKLGVSSSKTVSFVVEPVVPRITEIRITPNPVEAGQEFEIIAEVEYEEV